MSATFPTRPRCRPVVIALAAFGLLAVGSGCTMSDAEPLSKEKPKPEGDRLVLLLKKVADEGLLYDPDQLAKALGITMKFETQTTTGTPNCDAGGHTKSIERTKSVIRESWFGASPEGVPDMKVPGFGINRPEVIGAPYVDFSLYRSVRCATPDKVSIEAQLSFVNLSSFSCLSPGRLQKLIGTRYRMATDGVSISHYSPPPTDDYGTSLDFVFGAGAPCAISVGIRQDSRSGRRARPK